MGGRSLRQNDVIHWFLQKLPDLLALFFRWVPNSNTPKYNAPPNRPWLSVKTLLSMGETACRSGLALTPLPRSNAPRTHSVCFAPKSDDHADPSCERTFEGKGCRAGLCGLPSLRSPK